MKTITILLKKSLSTALAVMCAMLVSTVAFGQTYFVVNWDDYTANSNVAYCPCDYIKCIPPEGVTGIYWTSSAGGFEGDTLLLENGFDGQVTCFYDGGYKSLYLYPISSPSLPFFPTDTTTCMLEIDLDAGNYSQYGFTTYDWSNGASSQTVSVGPGTYSVDIHNVCGDVSATTTVHYDNPNAPDLGPDTEFCANEGYELFPGSADVNTYLWSTGSIDPSITVSESGEYWVYVTDIDGCSGRDTVVLTAIPTYNIEMCHVSFDTLTNKNQVTWFVDPMQEGIQEVVVYVKNEWGEWAAIETTDYQNGQLVDWNSNPQADYNEYRIAAISDCGEGEMSDIHRSIWLSTFQSELQWQNYYGTFVPDYYVVYARTTSGALQVMGNVPACSGSGCINHYAITANPDIVKYFVMFEHDCSSNKDTPGWVMSNDIDASVGITSVAIPEISLYPNPTTSTLTLSITADQASIYTLLGQELLSETSTSVLDVSTLPTGIYLLQVIVGNEIIKKQFAKQ